MLHCMRFESIADGKQYAWAENTTCTCTSKRWSLGYYMHSMPIVRLYIYNSMPARFKMCCVDEDTESRAALYKYDAYTLLWLAHTNQTYISNYRGNKNCLYLNTIWQAQAAYSSSTGMLWRETHCIYRCTGTCTHVQRDCINDIHLLRLHAYTCIKLMCVHPQRQCMMMSRQNPS